MKTHNISLKQAVTSALAILSLSIQINGFAIGLGDINVKSYLGQPLRATVKIQGLSNLKDLDCFRLGNGAEGGDAGSVNAIDQANLKLGKVQNDSATLTITTSEVILEPITSLTLIAECDTTLSRNYVLLIDPVMTAGVEPFLLSAGQVQAKKSQNNDENDENFIIDDNRNQLQPLLSSNNLPQANQTKTSKHNKNYFFNNKNSKKRKNKEVLPSNFEGNKRAISIRPITSNEPLPLQQTVQLKSGLTKAPLILQNHSRLSISGFASSKVNAIDRSKNSVNVNLSSPNLSLDKRLHFTPETAAQALDADTAIFDETTVLSNRLAHLEKQINVLQQRNDVLEADKRLQTESIKQASVLPTDRSDGFLWWPYVLGFSLITSSYFAFNWWHRRRQAKQLDNVEEVWVNLQAHSNIAPHLKNSELENDLFDLQSNQPIADAGKNRTKNLQHLEINQIVTSPIQVEEIAENNILDHADVFLSHGRIHLAIQLLQNHLLEFPKQSVTIWLFLLELLAKENLPEAYNQTALECKEHFNIRVAEFTNDEASEKQSFEDYVRLIAGLEQVWGTSAALVYCDDLIYNYRLESRIGFDKNALEEIILLRNIAQETLKSAEVIQMGEKKNMIKERKEAQIAANKQTKLLKMDELHLALAPVEQVQNDTAAPEELFEFNLIEYR